MIDETAVTRIHKVRIENFRVLELVEFVCDDLTLIVGMNNVGKTSVHEALRVFFSHDKRKFSADDRPHSAPGLATVIEVTFVDAGGGMQVVRMTIPPEGTPTYEDVSDPRVPTPLPSSNGLATVIHIPAFQAVGDSTKLTGPSPLRDLLSRALRPALSESSQVSVALDEVAASLTEATAGLEVELAKELQGWNASITLTVAKPRPDDLIKTFISPSAIDGKNDVKLTNLGAGLQRSMVYALISVLARNEAEEGDQRPTLLLFEEPEVFLHPSQVDRLHRELRSLAKTSGFQPIITTHSPRFLAGNLDQMTRVVRLSRDAVNTTSAQIASERFADILDEVHRAFEGVLKADDPQAEEDLDALRVALLIDPMRGAAFFAETVLVVEGQTEAALIAELLDDGTLDLGGHVEVVDALGKFNFVRWMRLLAALRIPHAILFDRDEDRDGSPNHRILNERIEQTAAETCGGAAMSFQKNLEAYLGAQLPNRADKKPAALLKQYRDGALDAVRLKTLCTDIEALVGRAA